MTAQQTLQDAFSNLTPDAAREWINRLLDQQQEINRQHQQALAEKDETIRQMQLELARAGGHVTDADYDRYLAAQMALHTEQLDAAEGRAP
jgi:hypothetical protein